MNELEQILFKLCSSVPEAIGAVLCDSEGEAVAIAWGTRKIAPEAEAQIPLHVPRALSLDQPPAQFLIKLLGAELCASLRQWVEAVGAAGPAHVLAARYRHLELLVSPLPEDFYVLLLAEPPIRGRAERSLRLAKEALSAAIQ